jgi:hypothetical protein
MALNVPLTGSMADGLLGLVHLPRMWQKGLLKAVGALPDDYVFAERGFDQRMMEGVGIDAAAFVAFLQTLPSYLETEAWVRTHATKLDNVSVTNGEIVNRSMSTQFAEKLRASTGIADAAFDNGARLNNLDDLHSLHAYVVANRGKTVEPVSPAITGLATGPLGILHLPRLWGKAVLKAIGALPEGYHSGSGPLDEQLAEAIGMDLTASVAYTNAELPTYVAYEAWVGTNATNLKPEPIHEWNERMKTRQKREEMATAERAELGLTNSGERGGRLLNDLLDWQLFHRQITARRPAAA